MFATRAPYQSSKPSTPQSSPARIRIMDYISPKRCFDMLQGLDLGSPDPSPLNSPVKGPRPLERDSLPSLHFPGHLSFTSREPLAHPSTPATDCHQGDFSKANDPDAAAKGPMPRSPPRKPKHKSKRLSHNNRDNSSILPHHRRAQHAKDKRDTARKRVRVQHERRRARGHHGLAQLRQDARRVMQADHVTAEDRIFLEQLQKLEFNEGLTQDLEQCRERITRAAAEGRGRRKERRARDEAAAEMWGACQDEEAMVDQEKTVEAFVHAQEEKKKAYFQRVEEGALQADLERQRAHEARERQLREEQERVFHQELARKAKEEEERQKREEELRQQQEKERQLREEELRRQQERDRQRREEKRLFEENLREFRRKRDAFERFLHAERERLYSRERERFARQEQARLAEQARHATEKAEQERQQLLLYEGKWNELRTRDILPPLNVWEMPWPMFGVVSCVEQITYQGVRTFLFHPQRTGVEGKTARDKVKAETLRFHPDKFNTRILPKIQLSQQAVAQAIAGAVTRILTRIMTEEEQEN